MKQLKAEHQCQLEEISNQLLQFEASLRAKEKLIEKNMYAKDQVKTKKVKIECMTVRGFFFAGHFEAAKVDQKTVTQKRLFQ